MDNVYSKSYLKDFLNKIYVTNLDNSEITNFLSELVTSKNNHFENNENNYFIMLILTCINKNNLTYQNIMLINEIINSLLIEQLSNTNNNEIANMSNIEDYSDNSNNQIQLTELNLEDNEEVKKYFLQMNKHLENNGNFPYPPKGQTSIITSGDNMTIPGVRYIINYIIDYKGDVVGIQGYPKRELSQAGYEEVYSDLIDSIFKDED